MQTYLLIFVGAIVAVALFASLITSRVPLTTKTNIVKLSSFVFLLVALIFLVQFTEPTKVNAQQAAPGTTVYQPNFWNTVSNYTGLVVSSNNAGIAFGPSTNQSITLRQNQGDGWALSITNASAQTGNLTLGWDVTDDGVSNHWTTGHPYLWTIAIPASSGAVYYTNFSRDVWNNFRQSYPTVVSNSMSGNTVTINYLHETHGNQ